MENVCVISSANVGETQTLKLVELMMLQHSSSDLATSLS